MLENCKAEMMNRFPALREISDDEWPDFFERQGEPWTTDEIEYLREWYGRDHILHLSYALGRPPWNLQSKVTRMRARGIQTAMDQLQTVE